MNRSFQKESRRSITFTTFVRAILLLISSPFASACAKDPRGSYPLTDPRFPGLVAQAAASLFRIYSVSADLIETIDLEKEKDPESRFQKGFKKLAKEKRVV